MIYTGRGTGSQIAGTTDYNEVLAFNSNYKQLEYRNIYNHEGSMGGAYFLKGHATAYCILLWTFEEKELNIDFMCEAIRETEIDTFKNGKAFIQNELPELFAKVPINYRDEFAWWTTNDYPEYSDKELRIKLLTECIEETHP